LLHELRVDRTRRQLDWIALPDISPALVRSILRAEDQRFFDHDGIDWRALLAAGWGQLTGHGGRGASTISMQLAARLDRGLPHGRRGLAEKWTQIEAARALEARWTKDEILETYLNLVTFRGELTGVSAAAYGLFDKHPSGIDETEAAVLAALIRSPNAAPQRVAERACTLARNLISAIDCDAIRERVSMALRTPPRIRLRTAHAPHVARRFLSAERLRVDSTLDASLQRHAHAVLSHQLASIGAQRVSQGAVVVADNSSGEVLAYVGGRGAGYVDAARAARSAGSTLKPFLYALAIERRLLTAASVLDDSPLTLASTNGMYVPHNYELDFKGFVSVRTSLGSSLNIPAVRTATVVGADAFAARLRALGFRQITRDGDHYGFALALGSAEVTLEQLVNAYRTLANGGRHSPLRFVRGHRSDMPVIEPDAAFIITDILADRGARGLTFGLENPLATPFWSAVKTGTSKDMRDNWCVGFSSRYTVGVWVGNFDGSPMRDVSGVTGAAPIWLEIMRFLHARTPSQAPKPPATLARQVVRFTGGFEATRQEYFLRGTEVSEVSLPHQPPLAQARIRYPGRSAILALDPDIPIEAQRVFFDVSPRDTPFRLDLDGNQLAGTDSGWAPSIGMHRLSLFDGSGTKLDEVEFEVRGALRDVAQK
jgi:penicillin-binding protein 1C